MHEHIIVDQIIKEAEKQGKVKRILIEVGDLANMLPKDLEEALKAKVDWKVEIDETESLIRCSCGYEGKAKIVEKEHDSTIFCCPKCDYMGPKVISGDEIIIKEVEID